jgi:hypothetical protein
VQTVKLMYDLLKRMLSTARAALVGSVHPGMGINGPFDKIISQIAASLDTLPTRGTVDEVHVPCF